MKQKRFICIVCILAVLTAALPAFAGGPKCPACSESMVFRGYGRSGSPTCTEGAEAWYVCAACGYSVEKSIGPLGHDYRVKSRKGATCTEDGYEKQVCERCGKKNTRIYPAAGHTYDAVVTEPSCTEDGATVFTCSACGDSYTEPIPAAGHTYDAVVTEPSCTEDGATVFTCSACGDSYTEPIPAAGHTYDAVVTGPSCTEDGATVFTCSACGDSYTEPIPAAGHTYDAVVTEPSCTEDGATVFTCSVCGDSYTEPIPAAGHRFSDWATVREPSIFREGTQTRTCTVCGHAEDRSLPKRKGGTAIVIGGAVIVTAGLYVGIRRHRAAKAAAKEALGVPSVKMKKLLLCLMPTPENEAFEALLKKKFCFTLVSTPFDAPEALAEAVKKDTPDVTVISARTEEEALALLRKIHETDPEQNVTVLGEQGTDREKLQRLKSTQLAFSVAMHTDSAVKKLVRLAMVAYRPDAAAEDYLENLTLITDALGLGFVSSLINAYSVKTDISGLIAAHGPDGVSDAADDLNDIAGLFGLERIADLAERVRMAADQLTRNRDADRS